jgi:hypothetical protein
MLGSNQRPLPCEGESNSSLAFSTVLGPGQAGERRLYTVANLYAATESQRGDSHASQGL